MSSGHNAVMGDDAVKAELEAELAAASEARKELGDEMEPALVDAFVTRLERRMDERARQSERELERRRNHQKEMVLGSMGISVPLFVVAAIFAGLPGIVVVCLALVAI